ERPASCPNSGSRSQVLWGERGPQRDRPCRRASRGGVPDRGLRLGQVHATQVRQPGRADRRGPHSGRGGGDHRPKRRREPHPAPNRHRLPGFQPLSTHDGPAQR
ncbi:hypothetical protein AVDCRST_MAG82-731, partial [uncultured Rubrobacteraceae bacterium]